jgi:haloalkane dehalogenase
MSAVDSPQLAPPARVAQPATIYPADFPYRPAFVEIHGHRIAYFDEGAGPHTLLMMHGNPVAGYVFAPLLRRLSATYRCVVPDLLGFGMSDKPAGEAAYSLTGHIHMMAAFVRRLELNHLVVIGHDWGGPIGFGAALRAPERVTHLVVLNTLTEAPMKIMPRYWLLYQLLLRTRRLADWLVREQALFQRLGLAFMAPEDRAVYFRANHDWATRAGIAAFPRMIPYNRRHPNFPVLQEILSGLAAWDIPALVLFSDNDSVFSAGQGKRFAQRMENAHFQLIPGPKHFLQYEQPDLVAGLVHDFLA